MNILARLRQMFTSEPPPKPKPKSRIVDVTHLHKGKGYIMSVDKENPQKHHH